MRLIIELSFIKVLVVTQLYVLKNQRATIQKISMTDITISVIEFYQCVKLNNILQEIFELQATLKFFAGRKCQNFLKIKIRAISQKIGKLG